MDQALKTRVAILERCISEVLASPVKADPSEFYLNPGEVVWRYFYYIPEQNMNLGELEQALEKSCGFEITDHGCDGIIMLSKDVGLRSSTSYEHAENIEDSTIYDAQVGMEITIRSDDEESEVIQKALIAAKKLREIMAFFK